MPRAVVMDPRLLLFDPPVVVVITGTIVGTIFATAPFIVTPLVGTILVIALFIIALIVVALSTTVITFVVFVVFIIVALLGDYVSAYLSRMTEFSIQSVSPSLSLGLATIFCLRFLKAT